MSDNQPPWYAAHDAQNAAQGNQPPAPPFPVPAPYPDMTQAAYGTELVPAPPAYGSSEMLLSIGDIAIYPDRVVTPGGSTDLHGITWVVRDNTTITEGIPAYAIVLAIIFVAVCLIGLFFLLIKEKKIQGYVEVSVQKGSLYHVTQIPISRPDQVALIRSQVDWARSLTGTA